MSARSAAVVLLLLALPACPRQKHAAVPSTPTEQVVNWESPKPAASAAERLTTLVVQKVDVTPSPVRRSAPATLRFGVTPGFTGSDLKLSWFGPDGWLVHDQVGGIAGEAVTFTIPSGMFPSAGRYHYELDGGNVEVANGLIDVVD